MLDKITDKQAHELMEAAITAARRGQRNWAEQLFSRVERSRSARRSSRRRRRCSARARRSASRRRSCRCRRTRRRSRASSAARTRTTRRRRRSRLRSKGTITVDGKPLDGVGLVELYPIDATYKKRVAKHRVVEQRNKQFWPHLLAIPPGSTVAFPNYDDFYHNVFSRSSTQPFDIGMYKSGQSRDMKFDKPGLVRLGCNVHASMAAFIFVVDAPAYVPVDGAKEFRFRSLAPGKYKARVWSERSAEPTESENPDPRRRQHRSPSTSRATRREGPSPDKFGNSRQIASHP